MGARALGLNCRAAAVMGRYAWFVRVPPAPRGTPNLTDEQWAALEPPLSEMLRLTLLGGQAEKHRRRAMLDTTFYVADNGCKWRSLPTDFPPWKTVYGTFPRWA